MTKTETEILKLLPTGGEIALTRDVVVDADDFQRFVDAGGTIYKRGFRLTVTRSSVTQKFQPFFALRSLSPSATEIHLVGTDAAAVRYTMTTLSPFVRSCLEVLGEGTIEISQLGGDDRWSGICVSVDDALLDVLSRQVIPRLHDNLAAWIKHLHSDVDVIWSPR